MYFIKFFAWPSRVRRFSYSGFFQNVKVYFLCNYNEGRCINVLQNMEHLCIIGIVLQEVGLL